MLKKILITAFFAVIFLSSFVNYNNVQGNQTQQDSLKKYYPEVQFDNSTLYSEPNRKIVSDWFPYYISAKSALAKDNPADAQKYTMEFPDAVNASMPQLMRDNVSSDVTAFATSVSEIRNQFGSTTDITEQRKLFSTLNQNLMPFLKTSGMHDRSVYILSCPEDEFFGNSIWFSDGVDAVNPYLGSAAKTDCIIVKENWIYK